MFSGDNQKVHWGKWVNIRTGILCKKWKCDVKKCLNELFFKIASRGNLKVAINWKLIKVTFVKKVMTLLLVLNFEGAVTLSSNKIIVIIFMFLNLTLSNYYILKINAKSLIVKMKIFSLVLYIIFFMMISMWCYIRVYSRHWGNRCVFLGYIF